jgi:hypothetical protein
MENQKLKFVGERRGIIGGRLRGFPVEDEIVESNRSLRHEEADGIQHRRPLAANE